ncbi:MAG: amylo-alpha-1,6-glucosidase [Longimicrobiales bacterium]
MIDLSHPYRIGALHAESWAGLVLSPGPGEGFAFRFAVELAEGRRVDGMDLFWLVHQVGPHAPDGSYARISFDLGLPFGLGRETPLVKKAGREAWLTLEWSREGENAVLGRLITNFVGVLEMVPFFPWDWEGSWSRPDITRPLGAPGYILGTTGSGTHHLALMTIPGPRGGDPSAPQRFRMGLGDRFEFGAAIAPDSEETREGARKALLGGTVTKLALAREGYESTRVHVDGAWDGLSDSITNNLHWMVLLKPETAELYVPAGRRWIFPAPDGSPDHWTVFGWDSYFNALELALESPELAAAAIRAGLATQYPTGCIPNWRGRFGGTPDRSQPPVGAFALAKIFARFRDLALVEESLPALEAWNAFWQTTKNGHPRRDGNGDGLFEWGSDAANISPTPPPWEVEASGWQRAAWESGQDDLPNWDEARWVDAAETFDLACVDLNTYLAMDMEALAYLTQETGEEAKARRYREEWRRLKDRMNERLWNEDRGLYLDRKWDGGWSPRVAASNFLPLAAGIPNPEQARRMLEILTHPDWFWGDFVLPTISRNDPRFPEQQYWRGTIWPPMNYLVYQGIKRYAFDEIAGELARRSVALFLQSWREYQLCRENYDSRSGEGGGQRYQSWGPLFALIGVEEFLDVTPWAGMTVGSLVPPGETTLRRIRVLGRSWTVAMGPGGLRLDADDRTLLTSSAPVVLRRLEVEAGRLTCETHSTLPLTIRLRHPTPLGEVDVDGAPAEREGEAIELSPGIHTIRAVGSRP